MVLPFHKLEHPYIQYPYILTYCNITDVSALGNVHTLTLSCCKQITDVSALGNVHTLDLGHFYGTIKNCIFFQKIKSGRAIITVSITP